MHSEEKRIIVFHKNIKENKKMNIFKDSFIYLSLFFKTLFYFECKECLNQVLRNMLSTESYCELCDSNYCTICTEKECAEKHLLILLGIVFILGLHYFYFVLTYWNSFLILIVDLKFYLYVIFIHFGGLLLHKHLKENIKPYSELIMKKLMYNEKENSIKFSIVLVTILLSLIVSFFLFFNFMLGIVSFILLIGIYYQLFE